MKLLLEKISVQLDDSKVLNDLILEVKDGEILGLIGPNGCGKTTTLLTILGIYRHKNGHIYFGDKCIDGLETYERMSLGILLVPQSLHQFWVVHHQQYSGFSPGLTVFENVYNILKSNRDASEWLKVFGLDTIEEKEPAVLSWGQQQRLALLRMCAFKPKALLLDEPFGAADWQREKKLKIFIRQFIKRNRITTIYTASKPIEAKEFCDRTVLMENGKVK